MCTLIKNSILALIIIACFSCATAPVDTFCVLYEPIYDYTDKGLSEKTEIAIIKNNGIYLTNCLKVPIPLN